MTVEEARATVVPLAEAKDAALFGAKTATLARLAATHRVPDGFALSAEVAERLAGLPEREAELKLRVLVAPAYATLGRGRAVAVAVRSSAIGEDSGVASFAGQHETVLGVSGLDALVDAVGTVWRSAASEHAAAYRREKGIDGPPRIAVLVQRMSLAQASVIAFTADPVSGDRGLVVVNAHRGLGDAMASGEVTPDMYQVRRSDLGIEWRQAHAEPALTDDQVREVARLALALEAEAGHPVDIEAAFEDGALWLLQSRPVTAAGERAAELPIVWPEPGDEEITWRREDAHFGGAQTPLEVEYVRYGPSQGVQKRNERFGIPQRMRFEEFNGCMYIGGRTLGAPEELARLQDEIAAKRRALGRRLVRDWEGRYKPGVQEHFAWVRALRPLGLPGEEAARLWEELWRRVTEVWVMHMLVTGGAYPLMDELASTYERLTGRPASEAFALTQGRAHTLQALQRDVYRLAETARRLPEVAAAMRSGVDALEALQALPGGAEFAAAVNAFLEVHGEVGQANEALGTPSWGAEPSLLIREVRRALEAPPDDPDGRAARLLAEGEALAGRTRETLRERPEELAVFEEIVAAALVVGPLTDEHNYWIDRFAQSRVRAAALAFGERLVADGSVERATDIWHFYVPEVADALRRPRDLRAFVREREVRHARNARWRAPEYLGKPPAGAPPGLGALPSNRADLLYKVVQDQPGVIKGAAASAGMGRGPARLVRRPADLDRVRAGDVLVCRSTNVSYVPVFSKVAAVVTEVGGVLSHAAVVAREFGVPCVVATGVALTELRDGEVVEVDGTAGLVRRVPASTEGRRP